MLKERTQRNHFSDALNTQKLSAVLKARRESFLEALTAGSRDPKYTTAAYFGRQAWVLDEHGECHGTLRVYLMGEQEVVVQK